MKTDETQQFFSLKELSIYLGITTEAIRYHMRRGRIVPLRLGRALRFDKDNIGPAFKKSRG